MNYQKHYDLLIDRARSRILEGYVERHHVLPKCLGGSDNKLNIVQLTPEEHFLAHVLLVKMFPEHRNLILAVQKMTRGHKGRRSRKLYGWLRRKHAARMRELSSGEGNSQFGSRWVNDGSKSSKMKKDEPLPDGWIEGRLKLFVVKRCVVCGVSITQKHANFCPDHRGSTKGLRYTGKSKATDQQVIAALQENEYDIYSAMSSLGYNPKGFGNGKNRFKKICASLV